MNRSLWQDLTARLAVGDIPRRSFGMPLLRGSAHNKEPTVERAATKAVVASSAGGVQPSVCIQKRKCTPKKRGRGCDADDGVTTAPKSAKKRHSSSVDFTSAALRGLAFFCVGDDTVISFEQQNPKRAGSRSWHRFEAYKRACSRTEFYALGGWDSDYAEDVAKGHLVEHVP